MSKIRQLHYRGTWIMIKQTHGKRRTHRKAESSHPSINQPLRWLGSKRMVSVFLQVGDICSLNLQLSKLPLSTPIWSRHCNYKFPSFFSPSQAREIWSVYGDFTTFSVLMGFIWLASQEITLTRWPTSQLLHSLMSKHIPSRSSAYQTELWRCVVWRWGRHTLHSAHSR